MNSSKIAPILTSVGFLTLGVAVMAIYANNQAVASGAVGATDGWVSFGNWLLASLGGATGIFGLIKQFFPQLGKVVDVIQDSSIGDQILNNISPILTAIDNDPTNDQPIDFSVARPLKNYDVTVRVSLVPRKA